MATLTGQALNLEQLINPTERQRDFIRAAAKYDFVLYGGAAGGGKSYVLRWWLVLYLIDLYVSRGLKNVQVALLCEDYPSLYDRHISKIKFEFPSEIGELKQGTTKNFKLRDEFGGGEIALRNLDDPSKYQSAEFAAIAVDELTKNSKETFDFLRFRLRWPGVERPKFVGATNPGGKGHAWVKKLWVTRDFAQSPELLEKKDQFAFVQARASDNPHLTPDYYKSLLTLPPDMARMFAEGDWNVFAGQYFTNFSEQRHVLRVPLEPWWPRWISGDWGYGHPLCVHWHAKDGDRVITYRELYGARIGEAELGRQIGELSKGEKINGFFFSPDAFDKRGAQNTIAQQVGDVLSDYKLPRPVPADNSRISGWRLLYELLDADLWTIDPSCVRLIETLPTLIRDEDELEDILKVDHSDNQIGDDAADSARYGLKSMLAPRNVPKDVQLQRVLTDPTIQDNHTRHMKHLQFEKTYKNPTRPFFVKKRRPYGAN